MKLLQKQKAKINNEPIIYHARMEKGLKEITPHKCKHDKAYVYASHNIALCIIFAVKRRGENIDFGVDKWGHTYITELYPGGFEDRFRDRSCCLYFLPEKHFKLETEYIERVSEETVPVLGKIEIADSAAFLIDLAKKNQLNIIRYKYLTPKQKKEGEELLKKRLTGYAKFTKLSKEEYKKLKGEEKLQYNIQLERVTFCEKKFPELMAEARENLKKENADNQ